MGSGWEVISSIRCLSFSGVVGEWWGGGWLMDKDRERDVRRASSSSSASSRIRSESVSGMVRRWVVEGMEVRERDFR